MPLVPETADSRTILSDHVADAILAAGLRKAADMEIPVSIAILDHAGLLVRFTRRAGSILASVKMAQDKAYTSISFGIPSHEWIDIIKDDPQLLYGIPPYPRQLIIGGGFPIRIAGTLVGGLGVSGGHYLDDIEIARAAIAVLETD